MADLLKGNYESLKNVKDYQKLMTTENHKSLQLAKSLDNSTPFFL